MIPQAAEAGGRPLIVTGRLDSALRQAQGDAVQSDNGRKEFEVVARLYTPIEVDYYNNGGILQTVPRGMVG
ncbi:MAG: hypothetical protein IID63_06640 [candidate division Zixibacteria bacterium]|nr:hypothetical protein [candidate division Zixibacteria bacterium]